MSAYSLQLPPASTLLAVDDDPLVLTRIYEPEIGAVLWQRSREQWVGPLMQSLSHPMPRYSVSGDVSSVVSQLESLLPDSLAYTKGLLVDVELLCDMFATLMDAELLGVRLATLYGPMCPKWHTDRVVARMIISIGGPGTEFTDRWCQSPDGASYCQASEHGVLVLRGDLWPGPAGRGVWHRSPDTFLPRLLLTVDAISN